MTTRHFCGLFKFIADVFTSYRSKDISNNIVCQSHNISVIKQLTISRISRFSDTYEHIILDKNNVEIYYSENVDNEPIVVNNSNINLDIINSLFTIKDGEIKSINYASHNIYALDFTIFHDESNDNKYDIKFYIAREDDYCYLLDIQHMTGIEFPQISIQKVCSPRELVLFFAKQHHVDISKIGLHTWMFFTNDEIVLQQSDIDNLFKDVVLSRNEQKIKAHLRKYVKA